MEVKILDRPPRARAEGKKGPVLKRSGLLYRDIEGDMVPTDITASIWSLEDDVQPGRYTVDIERATRVDKFGVVYMQFDRNSLVPAK